MKQFRFFFQIFALLVLYACKTSPGPETPLPITAPAVPDSGSPAVPVPGNPAAPVPGNATGNGGIVEEIRSFVEKGTPSSLLQALDLIAGREAGNTEFGRAMNGVIGALLKTVYPAVQAPIPPLDLPQNNNYARILRDNEKGVYTSYPASKDFLEQVLPFLALYGIYAENNRNAGQERLLAALPDLQRGAKQNPASVLAHLFMGIAYERNGRIENAFAEYTAAWELSSECYPAALGLGRIMDLQGRTAEAAGFLSELAIRFPDNLPVKRQLAVAYYRLGDWSRAEPAIAEILQRSGRDGEFILMRARVLVETGQFIQAQAPLDLYAQINATNRLYLFLRARVQAEGYHNRDAALNYLRSLLRNSGGILDDEASVYAARLLMESGRETDQEEGRQLLRELLGNPVPSLTVISLALEDAVRLEAWNEARTYLTRLLKERRSSQDLLNAYTVEKGEGNNAAALSYARELYQKDPSSEAGSFAYITALIDTGRPEEAARMIENHLASASPGVSKSRYYFLRSLTLRNEEAVMNDLRSSLFEDPRNLAALTAMFEIYHRRRDERRAVYYLKQALALSADNPRLKRYETEYAPLLRAP